MSLFVSRGVKNSPETAESAEKKYFSNLSQTRSILDLTVDTTNNHIKVII